jgi:hypothetical protein
MEARERAALKAAIMQGLCEEVDKWLDKQQGLTSGYDHESEFLKTSTVNTIILEKTLGSSPAAGMLKKIQTCFGKITIPKRHMLCEHTKCFGISSKLQEPICLVAQGYVFEQAEELLGELLGVELSAKQIQRVSEHSGEQLEEQTQEQGKGNQARLFYP